MIEYCKYHHKAEAESLPEDEKNTWDKDFVKVDDETLFNLILAANYLDIKPLLDLTCADPSLPNHGRALAHSPLARSPSAAARLAWPFP